MNIEEKAKGEESMGEKLKRGVLLGTREGHSTPSPSWKYGLTEDPMDSRNTLSARKLGAKLWEMEAQLNRRADTMSMRSGPSFSHPKQDDGFEAQPARRPSNQETKGLGLRNQLKPKGHNPRVEKVEQAQQTLSSSSDSGLIEMPPDRATSEHGPNGSFTPLSHIKESARHLKPSAELLKVLNRIFTLEEKHALDVSLVRALKGELEQAQARIQELLQAHKRDRNEINRLTARITELKAVRKKDRDRIESSAGPSGANSSFRNASRELERGRGERALLESLCDEFAKGIIGYEREARLVNQNAPGGGENDRFILHISEAWLDERAQSQLEGDSSLLEKRSPLDKLRPEIEAFLREQTLSKKKIGPLGPNRPTVVPRASNDNEYGLSRRGARGEGHFRHSGARERGSARVEGSFDRAVFMGPSSPVKKWVSMVSATGPDMRPESSSSRWLKSLKKQNTLRDELVDARLEGRWSCARTSRRSWNWRGE